jgi:hypothetical protein
LLLPVGGVVGAVEVDGDALDARPEAASVPFDDALGERDAEPQQLALTERVLEA